jgi:hypothetical protein
LKGDLQVSMEHEHGPGSAVSFHLLLPLGNEMVACSFRVSHTGQTLAVSYGTAGYDQGHFFLTKGP